MKRVGAMLLFWCWLLAPVFCHAALIVDTATPNQGLMGQPLGVQLKGSGFDATTRLTMSLDVGNKKALMGSVDTPGYAFSLAAAGAMVYVADGESGLRSSTTAPPPTTADRCRRYAQLCLRRTGAGYGGLCGGS